MRLLGYSASALRLAGFNDIDVLTAGYTASELRDANFTTEDLRNIGLVDHTLRVVGYHVDQQVSFLINFIYTTYRYIYKYNKINVKLVHIIY